MGHGPDEGKRGPHRPACPVDARGRGPPDDLVRSPWHRSQDPEGAGNYRLHDRLVDHALAGRRLQRPDGPVPVLGHRHCRIRRGLSRVCHHHTVVSVRRNSVRADGNQIGACAPARVHHHARHRAHLRATAARNRRRRLPADVHRPVRHRPRRHHVRRRHRPGRRPSAMGAAAGSARASSSSSCTRRRSSTR